MLQQKLGAGLALNQGAYDNCLYIRSYGKQTFRALEGSHAGDEGTIQTTDCCEIVLSIPANLDVLQDTLRIIFKYGVQEDPTVQIDEMWSSTSYYLDDKENPNRYWNRSDSKEIHGESSPEKY
ncbi:MAG: hypothetical protein OFPI_03620 [Osedax symbiont Rs2]|nr:MAG: hypothetical protein OFPI_03620 [Osedax symbiont Rs2]